MNESVNILKKNKLILSSAAAVAGLVNGFIGTGGGIILYFTLKFLNKRQGGGEENNDGQMKDIMAMIIASIIPMSIVSAVVYMLKGALVFDKLAIYLPGALIGGLAGALLLEKLKFKIVKKIFAALIIYAGVRMILG